MGHNATWRASPAAHQARESWSTGVPLGRSLKALPWYCSLLRVLFAPHLHATANLQAIPITRLEREAPWIEERYMCDTHGIIEVEMRDQTHHYARRYRLRDSAPKDHLEVE